MTIKLRAFLAAFEKTGNIDQAAKSAGLNRSSHYKALSRNPDYRRAFESSIQRAIAGTTVKAVAPPDDEAATRELITMLRRSADVLEHSLRAPGQPFLVPAVLPVSSWTPNSREERRARAIKARAARK